MGHALGLAYPNPSTFKESMKTSIMYQTQYRPYRKDYKIDTYDKSELKIKWGK